MMARRRQTYADESVRRNPGCDTTCEQRHRVVQLPLNGIWNPGRAAIRPSVGLPVDLSIVSTRPPPGVVPRAITNDALPGEGIEVRFPGIRRPSVPWQACRTCRCRSRTEAGHSGTLVCTPVSPRRIHRSSGARTRAGAEEESFGSNTAGGGAHETYGGADPRVRA